ncbi:hypothetical protein BC939DRAFT_30074 [Gamsiella multidivaricata]|uniref:uncharacterized protein n=1 Tax=Gamsiella multidivaricata TaxID=101098 RepID=UPI00221E6119|nr:uncharacterized protein BC939DRAFT_30074 [Gamsiella multidivaricata]KAI7816844.1 hypothetical protein BC939DRAFT_30074 [Gamsiella multidivaricata]
MLMRDYIQEVHADSLHPTLMSSKSQRRAGTDDMPPTPASDYTLSPAAAIEDVMTTQFDGDIPIATAGEKASITASRTSVSTGSADKEVGETATGPAHGRGPRRAGKAARRNSRLLYAKDVTCPDDWRRYLMNDLLPPFLGYMRENDLNTLNTKLAAENLMIYIGQAGTWTPAHIDQCGAIGHNIMAWADDDSSSIWFMIKAEDKDKAEALWRSFGHPLEFEGYFAAVEEMQKADFPIYVVEQKIGDFVMVPSLSYHQVVNLGKATIKVSWNRLTAHCLKAAVNVVLPRYRAIARPEGYRINMIIKSALEAWKNLLGSQSGNLPLPREHFCQSYRDILMLFRTIVEEEWVDMDILRDKDRVFDRPRRLKSVMPAVCDFCSSDVWNRQFRCHKCHHYGDDYDVCARCFSLGRGCKHRATSIEFVETFSMRSLRELYSSAVRAWNESKVLTGCQEYSPIVDDWIDSVVPSKDKEYSFSSIAYMRREDLKAAARICDRCHRCKARNHFILRLACPSCNAVFCESCLYEHHGTLWSDVVSKKEIDWKCPRCVGTCPCYFCIKKAADTENRHQNNLPRTPPLPKREPALQFTRPEDDSRNRGGVCDNNMEKSFASEQSDEDKEQENQDRCGHWSDDVQDQQATDTSRQSIRKSIEAQLGPSSTSSSLSSSSSLSPISPPGNVKKKRKMNPGVDSSELYQSSNIPAKQMKARSMAVTTSSAPSALSQNPVRGRSGSPGVDRSISSAKIPMTAEQFMEVMGSLEEKALRYAHTNGLWRTLAAFKAEQEQTEQAYYTEVFQMDAFWSQRSKSTRDGYRRDILEKHRTKTKP